MDKITRRLFIRKTGNMLFTILAFLFSFIFLYPIYFVLISAFKDNNEIWNTMFALPKSPQFENFILAVRDIGILRSVLNSFIFSTSATIIVVVVVTMGAYVIARKLLKIAGLLKVYYLLGLMVPAYGMLIPIVKLFAGLGLRDQYFPMIILYAGINFPLCFYLLTAYISSISTELDEAAFLDGCTTFGVVFRIIFPIAKPGIATAAIVSFLTVYNELIFANTLLQQKSMQTISVTLLGLRGERFSSWGSMFASIVLSIVPIIIVYFIFQDSIEKGVTSGAVKG